MGQYDTNPVVMGWKCPECGSIYGPMVAECRSCNYQRRMDEFHEEIRRRMEPEWSFTNHFKQREREDDDG